MLIGSEITKPLEPSTVRYSGWLPEPLSATIQPTSPQVVDPLAQNTTSSARDAHDTVRLTQNDRVRFAGDSAALVSQVTRSVLASSESAPSIAPPYGFHAPALLRVPLWPLPDESATNVPTDSSSLYHAISPVVAEEPMVGVTTTSTVVAV